MDKETNEFLKMLVDPHIQVPAWIEQKANELLRKRNIADNSKRDMLIAYSHHFKIIMHSGQSWSIEQAADDFINGVKYKFNN